MISQVGEKSEFGRPDFRGGQINLPAFVVTLDNGMRNRKVLDEGLAIELNLFEILHVGQSS